MLRQPGRVVAFESARGRRTTCKTGGGRPGVRLFDEETMVLKNFFRGIFGGGRGEGRDIEELARRLDMSADELRRVKPAYREVLVPKRRGGTRRLLVPAPELKALQRRIYRRLLRRLKAHPSATGFEPGYGIVSNAAFHAGQAVVVCLDVKDFFPSTSARRVEAYFRAIGWNKEAARLLTSLCTHEKGLPQGAPTSPRLSNLVNAPLDAYLSAAAAKRGARYTRYADDITFSTETDDSKAVHELVFLTKRGLKRFGYTLHEGKKLRIRRRHQRQTVTGLVVNKRPQLPREIRRWLRAVDHRRTTGKPASLSDAQRRGWQAYASMIERQAKFT